MNLPEAQLEALEVVRRIADAGALEAGEGRLLDLRGRLGDEALLEVAVAACDLLRGAIDVYAASPDAPLSAVLDGLARNLRNELDD